MGVGSLAEPRRAPGDGLEDRPNIGGRAADDAKDLARRGLLRQRLGEVAVPGSKLLEEAGVLDGDDGLGGEGLEELDLLVGERAELHAAEENRPDRHSLAEQGSGERGPVAEPLGVGRALRELGAGRGEIVHVDDLPIDDGSPRHPVAVDRGGLPDRPEGMGADLGHQAKHLAVDPEDLGVRHVAEPGSVLDDCLQDWLHLCGRAADDPQDLAGRGLLLEDLGHVAQQGAQGGEALGADDLGPRGSHPEELVQDGSLPRGVDHEIHRKVTEDFQVTGRRRDSAGLGLLEHECVGQGIDGDDDLRRCPSEQKLEERHAIRTTRDQADPDRSRALVPVVTHRRTVMLPPLSCCQRA